jgi:hypothetical protein
VRGRIDKQPEDEHTEGTGEEMQRIKTLLYSSAKLVLALPLLISLLPASPASAQTLAHEAHRAPAQLVQHVREATAQFIDVNNAGPAGYGPAFGCVSGPDHGAMGIHYVNGPLVGDGEIDVAHPEALIYEPAGNKRRLVGVEYIVDAATWLRNHDNAPPVLEGQDFQFVAAPNRFHLDDFFELHVWAWRDNPNGAFVDWNNQVTCERQ